MERDACWRPSKAPSVLRSRLSMMVNRMHSVLPAQAMSSGGWRMRAALAAALFAEPDLLLLDEPTNFLDLEGAMWLESRLKRHPSTALVISHDRELLDRSMDFILHLADAKLTLYAGGFAAFERQRAERLALQGSMRAKI